MTVTEEAEAVGEQEQLLSKTEEEILRPPLRKKQKLHGDHEVRHIRFRTGKRATTSLKSSTERIFTAECSLASRGNTVRFPVW